MKHFESELVERCFGTEMFKRATDVLDALPVT